MSAADIQAVAELRQRYWLNGYRPVAVYTGHKRPIGKGWLADAMRDPPLWATWQPIEAALSTGIATGRLVGVDVDVLIQPVVDRIVFEIQAGVCATPLVRIGRAPKTLLCFRCDGDPFRKLQTEVFIMNDGSEAKVELLAEGQQFVADGIHPDTGLAYLWPAGSPETVPLVDVPAITLEQAQAIVDAARALLIANGGVPKKKPQKERPRRERTPSGCQPEGHTFFAKVNSAALGNLDAWAPDVFPTAVYQSGTGAYRVASADLGRDLEEDISLHPAGIQDFGREHGMTAIDVVVEFGEASSPVQAALWLCGKLGLDPAQLGWRNSVSGNSGAVPPHAANGAGQEPPPGWEEGRPLQGEPTFLLPPEAPPLPGPRPLPTATLADVYAYHARTMLDFYRETAEGEPQPQIAIGGQGGIGKTEIVARFAREGTKLDQERGRPSRQMVLAPEHKILGKQLVDRYREKGIAAQPLLGRGNPFDRQPDDLCIELDDVGESLKAGQANIKNANCGTANDDHCRSFFVCPWQAAKARAAAAPLMVGNVNHLFHPLPRDVAKGLGRLVIEEDFTGAGVRIFPLTLESFSAAAIEEWPVLNKGERDDQQTRKLIWFGATFMKACDQDGDLKPEAMRDLGLRKEDLYEAVGMIRRRKVKSTMYPGMPSEERREAAIAEAINGQIGRLVTAISVAAEVFDGTGPGRITIKTETTKNGVVREITVHTLRKLAAWAADLPVALVNNSPQNTVARQFFPHLVERTPPPVAAPHAETRLIIGGFAKGTLEDSPRKRHDLNVFLKIEAIGQEKTSFVGFKGTKEEITQGVPGIIARHHNQNAGDDVMKDTRVHTELDGIRLKNSDLAKQVRAKTGKSPNMARAEPSTGRVLMWDGSGFDVPTLRYPDPDMQAEYEAHLYGSATQGGSARARAVRRTALDPVRINIFGRFAPPGEVFTSVELWRNVRPGRLGEMVLKARIDLNAATMTELHNELFPTEKSASRAREGFGDAIGKVRGWVARDTRPWVLVRWQRAGQGHALQWTICPAAEVDAARAEREAAFGALVHWQVDPFTPGQPAQRPVTAVEDIPTDVGDTSGVPGMSSPEEPEWHAGWDEEEAEEQDWAPDG